MQLPETLTGEQIQALQFAPTRSTDQQATSPARHRVVIVGAGPVGLSLAIDLAQRGQRVLLLDDDDGLSTGSRAICFSKRTLEIWDRLGVGQAMVDKGVSWQVGRLFHGDKQVFQFDLQPEAGHQRPAFINLQQYYAEGFLLQRALQLPGIEIRWQHAVATAAPRDDFVRLGVATPDGRYEIEAEYVCACDGSRSTVRRQLGLQTSGRSFRDRFLIADLKMAVDFPAERWFWFDPPFHRGYSVLLHRQPDGVWRIDWQLGWDADPEAERQPEAIRARVNAMLRQALGREIAFELVWASVYTFSCQRMEAFRHGRVLFAGDSAHGVSPFGARGANSGVQDAENLAWKLDAVLRAAAPDALLTSYASEREAAADENIQHSTRATDFITPKSEISRLFRDAVLSLAARHPFARGLVNSGRLSVPAVLQASPLNSPDVDAFATLLRLGAVAPDAPVETAQGNDWLLQQTARDAFCALVFDGPGATAQVAAWHAVAADVRGLPALTVLLICPAGVGLSPAAATQANAHLLIDCQGLAAQRFDAQPGTSVLLRPDQHLCARWRHATPAKMRAALHRALGHAVDWAVDWAVDCAVNRAVNRA